MRTIYLEGEGKGGVYLGGYFERFGEKEIKWTFEVYGDTTYPKTPVLALYCNGDKITSFSFGKREVKQLLRIMATQSRKNNAI